MTKIKDKCCGKLNSPDSKPCTSCPFVHLKMKPPKERLKKINKMRRKLGLPEVQKKGKKNTMVPNLAEASF